jgi:phosphatidylinositol alpha-1,6-mannosyltransferase
LKVLALVTEAYGGFGGIAQYNRDLIAALSASDQIDSIRVLPRLAPAPVGRMPNKAWQGKPVYERSIYTMLAFHDVVRHRPDLLICGHLYLAPMVRYLAQLVGAPFVVQTHGTEIWQRPKKAAAGALERAAAIFCVSRHTRAQVLKFTRMDPNRVVVVPNTLGRDYRPGNRDKIRAAMGLADEFALLTVGRLDDRHGYKGHDRVIRMLPLLRRGPHRVIYMISGEGKDRRRLEALAEDLGVKEQVRFLGYTPRDALPDLYRAVDLFAMPSTGEGFGIVFLEAMACGTPALGLAVGGASDPLDFGEWGKAVTAANLEMAIRRAIVLPRPDPFMMHEAVTERFGFDVFAREVVDQICRSALPARGRRVSPSWEKS